MTVLISPLKAGHFSGKPQARIKAVTQRELNEKHLVGTIALVVHKGELTYRTAMDLADRENQRPMNILFHKNSNLTGPDCLVDITTERTRPGPHGLRVAVRPVSVSPVDTKIRAGLVAISNSVCSLGCDAGLLRSTASHELYPLEAARLSEAHCMVQASGVTGKVVVACSMEDTAQAMRETEQ